MLFIDARGYYTVVDRTLNEWTAWQLKNLAAIVHLYRGEIDKYKNLVEEYIATLGGRADFDAVIKETQEALDGECEKAKVLQAKKATKKDERAKKKAEIAKINEKIETLSDTLQTSKEALWLFEKFGENGEWQDVAGLCKIASIDEIKEKGYSLTPGAYVGVQEVQDDGVDFEKRMNEIQGELAILQAKSNELMDEITKNWQEMRG